MGLICLSVSLLAQHRVPADILSDFTLSSEDWKVIDLADTYDAGPYTDILIGPYDPSWISKPGPAQGSIYHVDTPENSFYFSAPDKFLGDVSWSYGSLLSYELRSGTGPTGDTYSEAELILTGANQKVLVAHTYAHPIERWQTNYAFIHEIFWNKDNFDGPNPTATELLEVLSNVQSLCIRGEYYVGYDSVYLDNVRLYGSPEPRRALATASVSNGVVVGITIVDPGYGYFTPPSITLVGTSTSPASASARLTGKNVSKISIGNPGASYAGTVVVQIDPPPRPPTLFISLGSPDSISGVVWAGLHYRIEDSEDLKSWRNVEEFVPSTDFFTRTFEPLARARFFRVRELP